MRKLLASIVICAMIAVLPFVPPERQAAAIGPNDAQIVDIFGRTVNDYGIELVDWQGYIANPYVKLTVKPPAGAVYPVTVALAAQGTSRLMMDLPSTVSATGAGKTLTFANAAEQKNFLLEIHPDRIGGSGEIENYMLGVTITQNNGTVNSHSVPIRVLDQDDNAEPSLPLVFDYRYDTVNGYFGNAGIRSATERAIKDWFYFFDMAPFDSVASGAETSNVPNDNFSGSTSVSNNAAFTGEWIFLRGVNGPYSTGYPANNGNYHRRGGAQVAGPIHRSITTVLDFFPNFTAQTSLNDEEWYLTQNDPSTCTASCATDVYSVMMHEFGHGVAFESRWSGMVSYKNANGNDPDVVAYQGIAVPLDSSYHIPGEAQYWDRISGQNGGRTHLFPSKRWMLTKLTMLVAENVGWKLNKNLTPFLAPSIVTASLPAGAKGSAYSQKLTAKGGVPFYDWNVTSGSLPPGLTLDRFTGTISGMVSATAPLNSYTFTVQLRDYDAASTPVTKSFTISLGGVNPPTDLVAHYLFNETSGASGADASGNGKTATLSGGLTWAAGHAANAVNLNGTNGYGSLPTGIVNGLTDFTVATWVKVNNTSNWTRIFDFGTGSASSMFLTPRPGGAGLRFAITTSGSGGEQRISTTTAFPTGVWKHVAVTLSGGTGRLYVDGVQVATNAAMTLTPSSLGNTNLNYLGRSQYAGDAYLNGGLDDFRIYNRALSAAEVTTLFNS